ncbi:MAG TPA: DUF421 domain-containing protein [Clostridia bacterium]|jgi:uncharacterized membrane protein YcaP (DUF421 family)|nr:DUF421 domain-containing protein [Clostridia bacterium]
MLLSLIRTVILYLLVVTVIRLMGKRQIGELQPFELVIAIMISELAAIPMQDTGIPLLAGVLPIITLLIIQLSFSYLSLKSDLARKILCGTPSVLIENGRIMETELSRLRYNINDLLEQLREKNFPNIADVEFAILETSGKLSVIPKSQLRPLTPKDIDISTQYEGLPFTLISDGKVNYKNLKECHLDLAWLQNQLLGKNIKNIKQVLFAAIDTNGQLWIQLKEKYSKEK